MAKLDVLYRRSLFVLAIGVAKSQGVDDAALADIYRKYGDHLYLKGDFDGAMAQFVKTLGHLQPSYVIRKVSCVTNTLTTVPRRAAHPQPDNLSARAARARSRQPRPHDTAFELLHENVRSSAS